MTVQETAKKVTKKELQAVFDLLPRLSGKELVALECQTRAAMIRTSFLDYTKTERAYIHAADEVHGRDGECEIDCCSTIVSLGADPGAYVQAWVWVDEEDMKKFRKPVKLKECDAQFAD